MSIATNNKALGEITLFHPLLEIWSSSVTFDLRDVKSISSGIPPKELISNGRMFLIPQGKSATGHASLLSQLTSIRKVVERTLGTHGIRLMGGYAIPNSQVSTVLQAISDANLEFDRLVNELTSAVPYLYEQQVNNYPEWEAQLRGAQISTASIRSRCRFDMAVFEVSAPKDPAATLRFNSSTSGLFNDVLNDMAANARQIMQTTFTNRGNGITRKALRPVNRIIEKLDTFTFVDARLVPMAEYLRDTMSALPKLGNLSDSDIGRVIAMLTTIASPDDFIAFGTGTSQAVSQLPLIQHAPEVLDDDSDLDVTPAKPGRTVFAECTYII